jgi:hypothetical protein
VPARLDILSKFAPNLAIIPQKMHNLALDLFNVLMSVFHIVISDRNDLYKIWQEERRFDRETKVRRSNSDLGTG